MYNKFLKTTMIVFIFPFIPVTLVAMEFDEETTERTHLTSAQLRSVVKPVEASFWQSVEVMKLTGEWCTWKNSGSSYDRRRAYEAWEIPFGGYNRFGYKTICCCFSVN